MTYQSGSMDFGELIVDDIAMVVNLAQEAMSAYNSANCDCIKSTLAKLDVADYLARSI